MKRLLMASSFFDNPVNEFAVYRKRLRIQVLFPLFTGQADNYQSEAKEL
jgi:hypothetical protein